MTEAEMNKYAEELKRAVSRLKALVSTINETETIYEVAIDVAHAADAITDVGLVFEGIARNLGVKWCRICNRVLGTGPETICNNCEEKEKIFHADL